MAEPAAIAALLAVEQMRLELERALPRAAPSAELSSAAAVSAEQRLQVARVVLQNMRP